MPGPNPEFDAAWARFQARDSLILGPETLESAWAHGRNRYAALLIPIDDPETIAYTRQALALLSGIPGLEAYPEEYWHLTIKGIGFLCDPATAPDEVSEARMEAVSGQLADILAEQPRFEVQAGPLNAFPEVVILEAWDDGRVREINTRVLEAVPGIVRQRFDGPVFLPHISIARFSSQEALPHLKTTLAELRSLPPGPTFTVTHAGLICAHLSAAPPVLERLRRYELSD